MQTDTGADRLNSRLRLVLGALSEAMSGLDTRPVRVLDCGGGSGSYAVPLALEGADVTVVDISADALATLHRRADEAGAAHSVHSVGADVESLSAVVAPAAYDLVLAHGILEAVDRPPETFAAMVAALRPGGLLSIVVANPVASVIGRALAGDPAIALAELRELDAGGTRFGPQTVVDLCAETGLVITAAQGIGVFSDLVPGAALDAPGAREAVAELDALAAVRSPLRELAPRMHLLARRSGD